MNITAKVVPFSSVVGSNVTLHDESGKVVCQLALLNTGPMTDDAAEWKRRQTSFAEEIAARLNAPQPSADLPPLEFVGTISTLTPDGVSAIVALDPEVDGVKCAVLNTQTVGRLKLITSGLYKKGQPVSGTAVRGPDALLAVTIEAALTSMDRRA